MTEFRAAEADIDRFFEDQLAIRGVYRRWSTVGWRGQNSWLRAPEVSLPENRGAQTGLYLNVTGGLNWAIREANRLATGSHDNIPEELDSIATTVRRRPS